MTNQEIIDKAPDGATHYGLRLNGVAVYFKYFMGVLHRYSRPTKCYYRDASLINIKPLK